MSTAPDRSPVVGRPIDMSAASDRSPVIGRTILARSRSPQGLPQKPSLRQSNWGSSTDAATTAALHAFAAKVALGRKRRLMCIGAIGMAIFVLCILTFFIVPRVPDVKVADRSAATSTSRSDIEAGVFALGVSATLAIDNSANYFAVAFKDVVVTLAAENSPFATFRDSNVFVVPARSERSFTLSAAINTASDMRAIINIAALLGCADLATRAAAFNLTAQAAGCLINFGAAFTPVWLGTGLPRARTSFDVVLQDKSASASARSLH